MPAELCDLTGHELGARLRSGDVTATDVLESSLERVRAVDERLKTFLTVTEDEARAAAARVDEWLTSRGDRRLPDVAGIPLALKDVLTTRGIRSTAGSKILEPYVPPYDCTAWARLRAAGSVLAGKTNCDEFAMGSSGENSAYGPTRNPWDLDTVPGGSSSGSAAAVASGQAVWALGTDTGGSVRQPAALSGIVGFKPTYGRVSRYGLIAFASSLDHVATFSRDVRDAATLLSAIAGHDPADATSLPDPPADYGEGLDAGVAGLRVGVVEEWLETEGVQPAVRAAVRASVDRLVALGASAERVSLPYAEYALSAYYLIAPAECSSNLARYDGVRYGYRAPGASDVVEMNMRTRGEGFGDEVKRRIMLGTYSLSDHSGQTRPVAQATRHFPREERPEDGAPQRVRLCSLRGGVLAVRRPGLADVTDGGVPAGREDGGSAGHVPVRRLHHPSEPVGDARRLHPVRTVTRGAADRVPDHGPPRR